MTILFSKEDLYKDHKGTINLYSFNIPSEAIDKANNIIYCDGKSNALLLKQKYQNSIIIKEIIKTIDSVARYLRTKKNLTK
jgi:hypothetical protein